MPINLFRDLPDACSAEQFETLLGCEGVRIERITSRGQCSPEGFWYDQTEGEWLLLLQGQGIVEMASGERHVLNPGDTLNIPPHCRHRVAATAPHDNTVWLAVFYPAAPTPPQIPDNDVIT